MRRTMITEEQINKHAEQEYKGSSKGTMIDLYPMARQGFIAGMKKAIELMQPEWKYWGNTDKNESEFNDYTILLFDTGESCLYNDEDWPDAIVVKYLSVPEPPKTD